jgi:hypothetical protein
MISAVTAITNYGFELEGTFRAGVVKNGRILNQKMYAIIKEEIGTRQIGAPEG